MDDMDAPRPESPSSTLRRRNSISTSVVPKKLSLPTKHQSSSFPHANGTSPLDFELLSLKSLDYTSLRDLLPSTGFQSPTAGSASGSGAHSGYEISIRNRLVKQAAWAYLQPMSSSPVSSGRHFLHRMWVRLSGEFRNLVNSCLGFINLQVIPAITRVFDRLLRAIGVRWNSTR